MLNSCIQSRPSSSIPLMALVLVILLFLDVVDSFQIQRLQKQRFHFQQPLAINSNVKVNENAEVMGGVEIFEKWWLSFNSNCADIRVQHASFINSNGLLLRGIQYTGSFDEKQRTNILQIPRSKILSSSFSDEIEGEWDSNLAWCLLEECCKGSNSTIYGYCSLLTQGETHLLSSSSSADGKDSSTGLEVVPQHTAPDALRHWTPAQKNNLLTVARGKRLLELEQKQRLHWEQKYYSSNESRRKKNTLPQFLWAMEVVYSRAFCGDFGGPNDNKYSNILSIVVPLVATFIGYKSLIASYTTVNNNASEVIAIVCAIIASIVPIYYSQKNRKVAVLLPFIDSANHLEDADNLIEFDASQDCIALYAGPKCFVKSTMIHTNNNELVTAQQLFVNYGKNKKDEELLLNYGFLNNNNEITATTNYDLSTMNETTKTANNRDFIRRRIAETFVARYSDNKMKK